MKFTQLLNNAALTLHEGFLTTFFGDRGAVVVFLLVTAAFPDSLGFCFWLGIGLFVGWPGFTSVDLGLSAEQTHIMAGILLFVGVAGLWLNLRKMANRPAVRSAGAQRT